ncbi:MAG: hypothetical protein KDD55_12930, partial [Bdellovibrionales bacterium]|nr:hypothetical protein [Bdellovibrionales bacterium]
MRTILSLFFILTLASLPCAAIEISTNLPRNGLLIEHTDVPQSFSCTIQVPKEMSSIDLTQFSASMNGNSLPVTVDNTVELSDRMIISFGTLFELLDNGENVFICSYGSEIERRSFYNDTEAPSCEASPLTQNDLMITCIDDNQIVNNSLEFLNILDPMVTLEPQSQSVFIPVETPLFFRISDSSNNAHYYIHKPNALELELVGGELWDYTNAALSPPPPEGFSQLNVSHAFPIEIKLHIPHYRCEQEQEACHFNGNPNADLIQMHEVLQEAENRRQYAKQMIRDAFHHINSYLVANNYTPFLPIFTDSASELLPIEDDFRYGIRFTTRSSAATSSDDPLPIPTPIGPLLTTANHYYFNPELISPVEALGDQLHIIVVNKLIHLGGVAYPPFGTIVLEAQNNVDLGGLLEDLLQYFEGSELGEILHGSTDALSTAYATYSLDKFKTVHELGHIFGLGHTPHHGSDLMSYGTIKFEIDIAQLKMIAASMYGKEGQGLTWKEQFSKKFLNMGPMVGTTSLDICGSSMMGKGTN